MNTNDYQVVITLLKDGAALGSFMRPVDPAQPWITGADVGYQISRRLERLVECFHVHTEPMNDTSRICTDCGELIGVSYEA